MDFFRENLEVLDVSVNFSPFNHMEALIQLLAAKVYEISNQSSVLKYILIYFLSQQIGRGAQPTLGRGLHSVAKVAMVLLVARRRPKQITVQKTCAICTQHI